MYSVTEFKGYKVGQKLNINNQEYIIYRINDIKNQISLIKIGFGFKHVCIDELNSILEKENEKNEKY